MSSISTYFATFALFVWNNTVMLEMSVSIVTLEVVFLTPGYIHTYFKLWYSLFTAANTGNPNAHTYYLIETNETITLLKRFHDEND